MEHGPNGAEWTDAGVRVKCLCDWKSDPVSIGYRWIETLQAHLNAHLEEVSNG